MAKDSMLITCLVPATRVHQVCSWLEDNGASEMMVRAHRANGADYTSSTVDKSTKQQEWLKHHIKGDAKVTDLKAAWVSAGFGEHSIYGALTRAAKNKIIKKVKPGLYRGL